MSSDAEKGKLLAKLELGLVFVREELSELPATLELIETLAALIKLRVEHESPTKPRGTKTLEWDATEAFRKSVEKLPKT